jgi:putative NADPH-quinone reductase
MLKKSVLQFCGVKPVKITYFGPLRNSKIEQRNSMLMRAEQIGKSEK